MSRKNARACNRRNLDESIDIDTPRKWTVTEQNKLQQLIDAGVMSVSDSAAKAKDKDPMFKDFSNSVIGYHLGLLRKNKCKKLTIFYQFVVLTLKFVSSTIKPTSLKCQWNSYFGE